jgi:tetratricopeptide (TPR) repeat protein
LTEGRTWLAQAIAVSEREPPSIGRARCLVGASLIEQTQASIGPAEIHAQEGLLLGQALDDWPAIGRAQLVLANLAMMRQEFDRARQLHEGALACFVRLGDRPSIAITLINLGLDCHRLRNMEAARTYAEDALNIAREIGDRWDEIAAVRLLGEVARDLGNLALATSYIVTSLELALSYGSERDVAHALSSMSTVALESADLERAARCLGAAEKLYRQLGIETPPPLRPDWNAIVARIRGGLTADRFAQAWNSTSPTQTVREILVAKQAAG